MISDHRKSKISSLNRWPMFLKKVYSEKDQGTAWRSFTFLSLRIFTLLALFLLLEWGIMQTAQLSPDTYHQPLIIVELLKNLMGPQLVVLLAVLVIMLRTKSLFQSWSSFESGATIRWFITFVAFIMGWSFSTYDYNLYFNQGHQFDRVLLLGLVPCIFWRPIFVWPFVLHLVSIIWQFNYPIGGYSVAEQFLLVRILILFLAMFTLQGLTGNRKIADFVFISLTLIASSYWLPGAGKIRLNWIAHGHSYFLLFSTYAKGWLAFLDPVIIETMGTIFSWFDWPMRLGTLLLEFGAIFALWRRATLKVFLVGWILFHLGVFTLSGIFFWKWILLDVMTLILFLKNRYFQSLPIFSRGHFALSMLLIGGCQLWFKPVNLAWYDARANYSARFTAVGVSGKEYVLAPHFFAPYDYQFTLGGFSFYCRTPRLRITWGATSDPVIARALRLAHTPADVLDIESRLGKIRYNPNRAAKVDEFLLRFFTNLNARGSKKTWLSHVQSAPQLWTFPRGNSFANQEPITKLVIYQITSLFDGDQYLEIRNELLHELEIPIESG